MKLIIGLLLKRIKTIIYQLKYEKGFTLIEMMIVVTIIGVILGLIAPNIFRKPQSAKVTATKVKISQLGLPLLEYSQLKGSFPSTDEGLEVLVTDGLVNKKDILDPWGNPFAYRYPGEFETTNYEIWSYGADGKEGGEGYNADINSWD